MSGSILYAVACVVVPVAWGILVWAASNVLERKIRARRAPAPTVAQDDQV